MTPDRGVERVYLVTIVNYSVDHRELAIDWDEDALEPVPQQAESTRQHKYQESIQ